MRFPLPILIGCLGLGLCLAVQLPSNGLPATSVFAEEPADGPEDVLDRHGLFKLGNAVWITRSERQLRMRLRLDELDDLNNRIRNLEATLNLCIQRNANLNRSLEETKLRLKNAQTDAQKATLKKTRDTLTAKSVKPEELPAQPVACGNLIELTNCRGKLLLTIETIRRLDAQMKREYQSLAADEQVKKAISQLGGAARLGPANDYDGDLRRLSELERLVLTDFVPLFIQSNRQRVGGIVNDRVTLIFTWEPGIAGVVLTNNMAELADIDTSNGEPARLTIDDQGVNASRVVLSSLRFGRHELREVDAYILPPEAEDLGARIGPKAFGKLVATPQPEKLRLLIQQSP